MSGGPVGEGMSYWATIKITKELTKKELQDIVKKINDVVAQHGGTIVDEARASTAGLSSFSVGFRKGQGR
jgi:uncharacterized membrane protein (Fun14 family)